MNIFRSATRSILLFLPILAMAMQATAQSMAAYTEEIEKWHSRRVADLKAENGWLNLVGLHWLSPGKNSFGSGEKERIKFPPGTIPAHAGYFELTEGVVKLLAENGLNITVNGNPVQEAVIFHKDSTPAAEVRYGDLKWTIIRREDKYGVRLRYLKSPAVSGFKGIGRYAIDTAWKVRAVLRPMTKNGISITNVLGQTTTQGSPGRLSFFIGGKAFSLDALDGGKDELFIIFGDETNGVETYPSGRYVYVKRPGPDGVTIIDFNKAYNPPCAFTEFATCPLPPKQNILPLVVTAGEKNYGEHK